jgi:hypothetical protein
MEPLLEIDLAKKLLSTKDAAKLSGYNPDYLARLCRDGKIIGTQVGRTWLVSQQSLEDFVKSQDLHKQKLHGKLSEIRGQEYQHAQTPVRTTRRLSPIFKSVSSHDFSVSSRLATVHKLTSLQKRGVALLVTLVVMLIGVSAAQAAPLAKLAEKSLAAALAVSDGIHEITGDALAQATAIGEQEIATANIPSSPFIASSRSHLDISRSHLDEVAQVARVISTNTVSTSAAPVIDGSQVAARARNLMGAPADALASSDHNQHAQHVDLLSIARSSLNSLRSLVSLRGYAELGAFTYTGIQNTLSSYANAVQSSGDSALALGTTIRDAGTATPRVLARAEVDAALAWVQFSQNMLRGYSRGVYAWVDESPAVPAALTQAAYDTGSVLADIAGATPQTVVRGYQIGMNAWVTGTPEIPNAIARTELAFSNTGTRLAASGISVGLLAEQNAVNSGTELAYGTYQQEAGLIASVPNNLMTRVASLRAPSVFTNDSLLGTIDNVASVASALPAFNIGEQAALATYQALHQLFTNPSAAIASLFGFGSHIASAPTPAPTLQTIPIAIPPSLSATHATYQGETSIPIKVRPRYTAPAAPASAPANVTNITQLVSAGVTQQYVDASIQALRDSFARAAVSQIDSGAGPISHVIDLIQRYDTIAIKNSSFTNGTIVGSNITGGNIIANSLSITGASALPSITASSTYVTNATTTNATTTNSFVTNLITTNGTTTNAFATNFTSTNGTLTNGTITNGTITNLLATNSTTTNATSTNLFATNSVLTNLTSTNANLTNLTVSATTTTAGLSIGSLTGFLKATAGAISTSLINLAADVSGILPVPNGGTGTSSFATNGVLYGNGTNNLLTTAQGGANTVLVANNGAPAFSSAITVGTSITTPTLIATNASTTNATVTGWLNAGSVAVGTSSPWALLSVNPTAANTGSGPQFAIGSSTGTNFIVGNNGWVGIGTTSPASTFAVNGNGYFSGSLTVGNNLTIQNGTVSIGSATSTLVLSGTVGSNIIPSINKTYDLGSPALYWSHGYIDNLNVNNLSSASTSIGGTANQSFTINSGNATADAQDMQLIFFRGLVNPNAVLSWNHTAARFEFNQPTLFWNQSSTTTIPSLIARAAASQTADIFQLQNSAGSILSTFNASGALGIGSSSPWGQLSVNPNGITGPAFVIGSSTATNFIVTNAGNVGIGTTSPVSALALGAGQVEVPNGTNAAPSYAFANAPSTGLFYDSGNSAVDLAIGGGTQWRLGSFLINSGLASGVKIGGVNPSGTVPDIVPNLNDTTTGIGASASGALSLITAGTDRIEITNGGNVGIGTTTPNYKLHVAGGTLAVDSGSGTDTFVLRDAILTKVAGSPINSNTGMTTPASVLTNGWTVGNSNNGLFAPALNTVALGTNALERLRIDASGNVGIGTTSPTYPLSVATDLGGGSFNVGDAGFSGYGGISLNGTLNSANYNFLSAPGQPLFINRPTGQPINFREANGSIQLTIASGGNVGIGTTTSLSALSVAGNTIKLTGNSSGGNGVSLNIQNYQGTNAWAIGTGGGVVGANDFSIGDNTNYRLVINGTTGNVGISTASPTNFKLQVAGNIGPDANATYDLGSSANFFANAYVNNLRLGTAGNFATQQLAEIGQVGNGSNRIKSNFGYWLNAAPTARADQSTLAVGNGPWDNTTAGFFNGSSAGTQIGVNAATGFTGNLIDLQTAGSSKFLVTGGGNVGIGTTSPASLLSVAGNGYFTGNVTIGGTASAGGRGLAINSPSALAGMVLSSGGTNWFLDNRGTSDTPNNRFAISAGGSDLLTILGSGNIGIGTSSPSATLSVAISSTTPALFVGAAGSSTPSLFVAGANSNGLVGIGTSAPTSQLTVVNTAGNGKTFKFSDGTRTLTDGTSGVLSWNAAAHYGSGSFAAIGDTEYYGMGDGTNRASFYVHGFGTGNLFRLDDSNGTTQIAVTAGGSFGIGTTSPWAQLSVNPNGVSGPAFVIGSSTATNFIVTNGGNVGIGTTNPVARLTTSGASADVAGGLAITAAGGTIDWRIYGSSNGSVQNGGGSSAGFHIGANAPGQEFWIGGFGSAVANAFQSPNSATAATVVAVRGVSGQTGDYFQIRSTRSATNGDLLTVNSAGNLGIGTTTPAQTLSVQGSALFSGNISAANLIATGTATLGIIAPSNSTAPLYGIYGNNATDNTGFISVAINNATQLRIQNGAAIIGSGASQLNFSPLTAGQTSGGTQTATFFNKSNGNTAAVGIYLANGNSDTDASLILNSGFNTSGNGVRSLTLNANGGPLALQTGGTNALYINSSQQVGIGTTSPAFKLDVAGPINTDQYSGFYQGGSLLGYASSTNTATIFGLGAGGQNATTSAAQNIVTAVGYHALNSLTTGFSNLAIGYNALSALKTGHHNLAIGYSALGNYTGTGNTINLAIGESALGNLTSGVENVAIGGAGVGSNLTTANDNVLIGGLNTANNASNLTSSVFIGAYAGQGSGLYTSIGSVYIGRSTGFSVGNSSDYNTFVGGAVGSQVTSGYGNTLIGQTVGNASNNLTTGGGNIGIGYNIQFPSATGNNQLNIGNFLFGSMPATTTNSSFVLPTTGTFGVATSSPYATLSVQANNGSTNQTLFAIGSSTASATTTLFSVSNTGNAYHSGSVGIGTNAPAFKLDVAGIINIDQYSSYKQAGNTVLYASTTNNSIAVGASSAANWMAATSTVSYNTAVGIGALAGTPTNSSAQFNTAVGFQSLFSNTTGANNTAIGSYTLGINTTGIQNTAIGVSALQNNTTGNQNTANGFNALSQNTTGSNNTAFGAGTLVSNTTGIKNTASGFNALASNTTGVNNTANGYQSLASNTTGSSNTLLGYQSGYDITSGANNTILGTEQTTGTGITTGSNNILIGNTVNAGLSVTGSNQLNIGNLIFGTNVGTGSTLSTGNVGIGTTTPTSALTVIGDLQLPEGNGIRINRQGSTGFILYQDLGDHLYLNNPNTNDISFQIGSATKAYLSAAGLFGINTASPQGQLSVVSTGISGHATSFSAWSNKFSLFGPNAGSATGAALGLGYDTTDDASSIYSLAPNVAWKPLNFNASSFNFYEAGAVNPTLNINGSGSVGIGTSTPLGKLHVVQTSTNDNEMLTLQNAAGWTGGKFNQIAWRDNLGIVGAAGLKFDSTNGTVDFTINSLYNGSGYQSTTSIPFIVKGNGNVGIGTTTPSTRFQVSGTTAGQPGQILIDDNGSFIPQITMYKWSGSGTNYYGQRITSSGTGDLLFQTAPTTGYIGTQTFSTALTILNPSGFVGIGTTTPAAQLEIAKGSAGTGSDLLRVTNSATAQSGNFSELTLVTSGATLSSSNSARVRAIMNASLTTDLGFFTNSTQQMTILSNGNVGIGTTTPATALSVYTSSSPWAAAFQGSTGGAIALGSISGTATVQGAANGSVNTTTNLALNPNGGNVGIATTNPYSKLVISGDLGAYSASASSVGSPVGASIYLGDSNFTSSSYYNSAPGLSAVYDSSQGVAAGLAFYTYTGGQNSRTERLRIASAGNVGIGSTSPYAQLSVFAGGNYGSQAASTLFAIGSSTAGTATSTLFTINSAGLVGIGSSTPSVLAAIERSTTQNDNLGTLELNNTNNTIGAGSNISLLTKNVNGTSQFMQWQNNGLRLGTRSTTAGAGNIYFTNNDTANAFLGGGTGNCSSINCFGIGTTSPAEKIDVYGSGNSDVAVLRETDMVNYPGALLDKFRTPTHEFHIGLSGTSNVALGADKFYIRDQTNSANRFVIDSSGNVGIGTTSPANALSVVGRAEITGDTAGLQLYNSARGPAGFLGSVFNWTGSGSKTDSAFAANGSNLQFFTNNSTTAALTINASSNVGIGTTSPWAQFSIHANSGSTNTTLFAIGSSTASATTTLFSVSNTGNVGIGAAAILGNSLYVPSGTAYFGGLLQTSTGLQSPDIHQSGTNGLAVSLSLTGKTLFFNSGTANSDTILVSPGLNDYTGSSATIALNPSGVSYINGGNVGIGTTTALARLTLQDSGTGVVNIGQMAGNSNFSGIAFTTNTGSQVTTANYSLLGDGTNTYINAATGGAIYFRSNNVNKAILTGSGAFAIATTSTYSTLTVAGSASIGADYSVAAPANGLIVEGNVGIGTTTPNNLLTISANSNSVQGAWIENLYTGSNTSARLTLTNPALDGGNPSYIDWNAFANNFTFQAGRNNIGQFVFNTMTSGTAQTRLAITNAGNVGIGTTSPTNSLSVAGSTYFAGNVGFGTNAPSTALQVVGTLRVVNTTNPAKFNDLTTDVNGYVSLQNVAIGTTIGAGNGFWNLFGSGATSTIQVGTSGSYGFASTATASGAANQDVAISRIGTNTIGIGTGAVGNSAGTLVAGTIGIGTTTPTANLVVNGTTGQNLLQIATSTNQNILVVDQNGNINIGQYNTASGGATINGYTMSIGRNGLSNGQTEGRININGPQQSFVDSVVGAQIRVAGYNGVRLAYGSTPTTGLILDNSGNVSLPVGTLTVSGAGSSSFVGNVGIGTTTPSQTLSIVGNLSVSGSGILPNTAPYTLSVATDTANIAVTALYILPPAVGGRIFLGNSTYQPFSLNLSNVTGGIEGLSTLGLSGLLGFTSNSTWSGSHGINRQNNDLVLHSEFWNGASDGNILFKTSPVTNLTPVEVARISRTGLFGIGTTSPYAQLSVFAGGDYLPHAASTLFAIGSSTAGTATSTLFTVLSGGNVGIGSTSPSQALTVNGSEYLGTNLGDQLLFGNGGNASQPAIRVAGSNTNTGIFFTPGLNAVSLVGGGAEMLRVRSAGVYASAFSPLTGNTISFSSALNGTALFYIQVDPTGNTGNTQLWARSQGNIAANLTLQPSTQGGLVGIGTTTPFAELAVMGSSTDSTNAFLVADSNNSPKFQIQNNGLVGIGTTSPSQLLSVQGNILADGIIATSTTLTANTAVSVFPLQINIPSNNGGIQLSRTGSSPGNVKLQVNTGGAGQLTADGDFGLGTGGVANVLVAIGSGAVANTLTVRTGLVGIGTSSPSATLAVAISSTTPALFVGALGSSTPALFVGSANSNGNVGIGTSNPTSQLTVSNTAGVGKTFKFSDGIRTLTDGTSGVLSWNAAAHFGSGVFGSIGDTEYYGLNDGSNRASFYVHGFGTGNLFRLDDSNGNTQMAVTAGGNVGVGSTTPYAQLSVFAGGDYAAHAASTLFAIGSTTAGTATSTLFTVSSNGNAYHSGSLGIGTTSPMAALSIQGGQVAVPNGSAVAPSYAFANSLGDGMFDAPGQLGFSTGGLQRLQLNGAALFYPGASSGFAINLQGTSGTAPAFSPNRADTTTGIGADASGNISLITAATTKLEVLNNGNVGVGSTSPYAQLSVFAGGDYAAHAASTLFAIGSSTAGTATSTFVAVTSGGNVGIGSTSPWRSLDVNGTVGFKGLTTEGVSGSALCLSANNEVQINSGVQTCTVSSQRYKHDIVSTDTGLATVLAMNPVTFYYNADTKNTNQQYGFIAEQVQQIDPKLVDVNSDGQVQSVRYEEYTAVLTRAIQQLATGYSLGNVASASSTVSSSYAGVAAAAINVDASGNVGIGNSAPKDKLSVAGNVAANGFTENGVGMSFSNIFAGLSFGSTTAASALSADGQNVDLYKMASVALTGVQQVADQTKALSLTANALASTTNSLAAQTSALASTTTAIGGQVQSLSARVAALEAGATAGLQSASSSAPSLLSASSTQLASALASFGVLLQNGLAQFNTLVVRNLVFSKDVNGASAAGSSVILAGNTTVVISNPNMLATSQVSVTLTSPLAGNWYVSNKQDGSFRVTLSAPQTSDVSFDYIIVQTQGQIATTTPTGYVGSPFSWISSLFGAPNQGLTSISGSPSASGTPTSGGGMVSAGVGSGTSTASGSPSGSGTATSTPSAGTGTSAPSPNAPVVTLNGAAAISLTQGDLFTDPGATAKDVSGANITSSIKVTGAVDTSKVGIYTLTYTATDAAKNTGSASRVVTVAALAAPAPTPTGGSTPTPTPTPAPTPTPTPTPAPAPTPTPAPSPSPTPSGSSGSSAPAPTPTPAPTPAPAPAPAPTAATP